MASSSSPSAPATSQPLHNFELPPVLKWNSKDGKSGGSHRRHHRSMKSPPQWPNPLPASPIRRSPPRDPAAQPRIQTHLPREDRTSEAVGGDTKEPAIADEFERLALLREESLRHHRGRDWWSETRNSDVIAYRRNPLKKSAFAASSSRIDRFSNWDFKISDPPREIDVYRRNPYKKSSFVSSPVRFGFSSSSDGKRSNAAGEDDDIFCRNPFKRSAFAASLSRSSFFNSEEGKKSKAAAGEFDTYHRNPFRKSFFSSNYEERKSRKAAEKDAYHRNPLKKSAFASSPKRSEERKSKAPAEAADADTYPKNLLFKKSAFASSPKKHTFPSNSETEKKAIVAEADASNPTKKSAFPSPMKPEDRSCKVEKKPKVAEGDHTHVSPKMKSPFASPAKKLHASSISEESKVEKKSKGAEADANTKKQSPSSSENKLKVPAASDVAEIKKEEEDGDEEIKVWNLRPRIVKSKPNNSKNKGQQQLKSGGGEKKEEKEKLNIAISLTKQEIEEDIFALTGAKPSRRPRKRPKNVQKQLDTMFPGLWLLSITSDSYKVSENSLKG